MNIVLGSHYFHPHIGGIESVVESHAKRLSERGHSVTVVCSDVGAEAAKETRNGYTVERYKAWNPLERIGVPYPIPNPVNITHRLGSIIEGKSPDIAHVHGLNYLTTSPLLYSLPQSVPVILHQHTPFVEYPMIFELFEHINDNIIGRWNLAQADIVFCVTSKIEQYVQKLNSAVETEVLSNGVDTAYFHPDRNDQAHPFDCAPEQTVFFTLSRMSQKKGIDVLLDAVTQLSQMDNSVHIAVAGDGPMREEVERAAQVDTLEVMGTLSDRMLAQCYAAADCFLFTSRGGEAFPTLTMIESYASGTPVIASKLAEDVVGIEDEENTILVEPGNSDDLFEAIVTVSAEKKRLSEMGKNARQMAVQHYSIESRIDRLEACYRSLVTSSY